jgi:hypothetical protein
LLFIGSYHRGPAACSEIGDELGHASVYARLAAATVKMSMTLSSRLVGAGMFLWTQGVRAMVGIFAGAK